MRVLSDYQEPSFGKTSGMHNEELKLLARGTFVLDKDGKVIYAETVNEVTQEPNYDATLSAIQGAL
jgi:thiol peroxidase